MSLTCSLVRDDDGDDDDDGDNSDDDRQAPRKPLTIGGLSPEDGLLDVGRVIALAGYGEECKRLPFLGREYYEQDDFLLGTKRVRYGYWKRTRLMSLAYFGRERHLRVLLRGGAETEERPRRGTWRAISLFTSHAAESGEVGCIRLLVGALHHAAAGGHADMVELLIALGVGVNLATSTGTTALHVAAAHGTVACVEMLVDCGARVGAREDDTGSTALHMACGRGDWGIAKLLIDRGASINARDDYGWTPLACASDAGHSFLVASLLDRDERWGEEEVDTRDKEGRTPLMLAARAGHADIAEILLDAGADVGKKDYKGWTALHMSCHRGHADAAVALLNHGANANKQTGGGMTPLGLADRFGRAEVAALLRSRGVRS